MKNIAEIAKCSCIVWVFVVLCSCNQFQEQYYINRLTQLQQIAAAGNWNAALYGIDSLRRVNPSNSYLLVQSYLFKRDYYSSRHSKDSSIRYNDSALVVMRNYDMAQKYPQIYALALNEAGNMFFEQGNMKSAFECYYSARRAARSAGDSCLLADQSYHLGMVTYKQQKYNEAVSHFQQALAQTGNRPTPILAFYRLQEMMNNMALAYAHLGMDDSALVCYCNVLHFIDSSAHQFDSIASAQKFKEIAVAVTKGNLAKIYINRHNYDTAKMLLKSSIATNSKSTYDNSDALRSQMELAELYYKTHEYVEMESILHQMRRPLDSIRDAEVTARYYRLRYQNLKQLGLLREALASADSCLSFTDTLTALDGQMKQSDYARIMEGRENQYQRNLLQQETKLNRVYLFTATGFILAVLVVVLVIYITYKKTARNLKTLSAMNIKINAQNSLLENAMTDLSKVNLEKDRILQVVAHDLRSPVSATIMIVKLITDEIEDESHTEMLRLIETSCNSQLTLINELLEYSDQASRQTEPANTDFGLLVSDCITLLLYKAAEKNQSIVAHLPPQQVYILVERERIIRVINNLITNAIKFSHVGNAIELFMEVNGQDVILTVKDAGIGIPERYQPNVFESFTPAKRNGTAGEKSFGIGLSICRNIVAANAGKIWFESTEGVGTRFFLQFPVVDPDQTTK